MLDTLITLSRIPGFGGGNDAPVQAAPPPPPPPPEPPKKPDKSVQQAKDDEKKKAQLRAGAAGTVKTGSQGVLTDATTTDKTLI